MSQNNHIVEIINKAIAEEWPYPKTFNMLKENGVLNYEVSWHNGFHEQFNLSDGTSVVKTALDGFTQPEIAPQFSKTKAQEALTDNQNGKTTYLQWIYAMSAAGGSNYVVNMHNRTINYFNPTQTESIVELVPE